MIEPRRHLLCAILLISGACAAGPEQGAAPGDAARPPPSIPGTEPAMLEGFFADNPSFLHDHHEWHRSYWLKDLDFGERFFVFHRETLRRFDRWRAQHGFGPIQPWDPGTPIPDDVPHARRDSSDPSAVDPRCRRPSWFTTAGGEQRDPQTGARSLADFSTSSLLGASINAPGDPSWHGSVHNAIGGDMGDLHTAPRDPIFWRFHKLLDDIWVEWHQARGLPLPP